MNRRFLHSLLVVPLALPLASCKPEIANEEAAECIFDAMAPSLRLSFAMIALSGTKMPEISMNEAFVKECMKSGPSTFDCQVEFSIHLSGKIPDFYAAATGLQPDESGNLHGMSNWRFLKGTDMVRCQLLQ
ncbi:MAG: hypothetical protein GX458_17495 [Phyllobacteriaceae bacterium]|nr:hypothetical protein [Phyllobacteriaceae bacterium]